jgi:hypothetical protein
LDSTVYVGIVSLKERIFYKNKIKKGQYYKMRLTRYFERPLVRSIEYKPIYDVMIGKNSVGILSTGLFSYLFVTKNLRSLEYLDPVSIANIEIDIKKTKIELYDFLYQVVKSLSFKEDSVLLVNYLDTAQVKKSLKRYTKNFTGFSPSEDLNLLYPPQKIERLPWKNYNIKTNNFHSWFWGTINYFYKLPINRGNSKYDFDDFVIKVLDFHDELYTVRVRWKIHSQKQSFSYYAVFTVKKQGDTFKIVGLNKPICCV